MTVLKNLDRFHLVMDTIDRLPQTGDYRTGKEDHGTTVTNNCHE